MRATLAALCLLSTQASAEVITIGTDRGGFIMEYAERVKAINERGDSVRITGRKCFSACTLYLGAERVCVGADTVFGFHAPTRYGVMLQGDAHKRMVLFIAKHYPPALAGWYQEGPAHSYWPVKRLGKDLPGVSICT